LSAAGTRVELRRELLPAGERAPGVPADTAATPYEMRIRGRLVAAAEIGESAAVLTASGRVVEGVLERESPGDDHGFGVPHPALIEAIESIAGLKRELDE
jgi:hypothetical protein